MLLNYGRNWRRCRRVLPDVVPIFVHSSTASHYEMVNTLLLAGKHVYVDKPLAQAEALVVQVIGDGFTYAAVKLR